MTRKQAKKLGLMLYRLLTLEVGVIRRLKPELKNPSVLYGLDGPQEMKLMQRKGRKPPDMIQHPRSGIPVRPLYCDVATGQVKRAVPVDWDWGVDYLEARKVLI